MGKSSTECSGKTAKSQEIVPFYIIWDCRKTLKLKKQRDLRKKKIMQAKQTLRQVERNEKMNLIQGMNRSMLDDDLTWNKIQEDIRVGCSEELYTNTNDHESDLSKRIQKLRWEVLFTLGSVQKQAVFQQKFAKFEFGIL